MLIAGDIRYEVQDSESSCVLRAFLPPECDSKTVDVLVGASKSDGSAVVHFKYNATGNIAGIVSLPGCMPSTLQAKFVQSKRRYDLSLPKVAAASSMPLNEALKRPSASGSQVSDHNPPSDQEQSADEPPSTESGAAAAAGTSLPEQPTTPAQHEAPVDPVNSDDEAADDIADPAASKKKKKKKKKKNKDAAAAADGGENGVHLEGSAPEAAAVDAEANDADEVDDDAPAAGDAETEASKKKRKKKKKKKAAAAAGDPSDAAEPVVEGGPDVTPADAAPRSSDDSDAEGKDAAADAASAAAAPEPLPAAPTEEPQGDAPPAPKSPPRSPSARAGEVVFGDAEVARAEVGAAEAAVGSVAHGPVVRHDVQVFKLKQEDKNMQQPSCLWHHDASGGTTPFSAFGIFDGHGGKHSATFASKHLLQHVLSFATRATPAGPEAPPQPEGLEPEDAAVFSAQEALLEALPQAMEEGFLEADTICRQKFPTSGTTATLAVQVGWALVVASVGDSLAYLDTGAEVVQVSANHRLDDCREEWTRIEAAGGEISQATAEGEPVGPMRVWPGGLAMSRTIGDREAGDLVQGLPEVRQVAIPTTGARLIIASDGLWDGVQAKSLLHSMRREPAKVVSHKAVFQALNKRGNKDDITVLVIDFMPAEEDRLVPALVAAAESHHHHAAKERVQVWRPLEASSQSWRDRLRQQRADLLSPPVEEQPSQEAAEQLQEVEAHTEENGHSNGGSYEAAGGHQENGGAVSDTYRELMDLRVDASMLSAR